MKRIPIWPLVYQVALVALLAAALFVISLNNYLLFHTVAELFSITVAFSILILVWNARAYLENGYLLFLGIGSLFIGAFDLLHTLAYKGMNIFPGATANLPTQLWLAARYLQALSFFFAPLFLRRRLNTAVIVAAFATVSLFLGLSIFAWRNFPDAYLDGSGLTPFKIASEYAIIAVFAVSGGLLWRDRRFFDPRVLRLLILAILVSVLSELLFTVYIGVDDLFNLAGHYLKIVAFYLLYKAIIDTGFVQPYNIIFRNLKHSEAALRRSRDDLEDLVRERTRALEAANRELREEVRERAEVQAALARQQALLQAVFQQAADGILVTDMQGNVTMLNPAAVKIMQVEPQRALAVTTQSLGVVQDADGNSITAEDWPLNRALHGETVTGTEYHVLPVNGQPYDALVSAAPLVGPDGAQVGAVAVFADITRRKQAEEGLRRANQELELRVAQRTAELERANAELRANRQRLDRLVDSNLIGVLYSTESGEMLSANDALLALIGYSRAELERGEIRWTDLTPPEFLDRDRAGIREAQQNGSCLPYEKEYIHKTGLRIPILIGYATLEDSPGEYVCFVVDLTRQKQDEAAIRDYAARLEQSNRELQEFAYVASHDLQEPLRKIIAFGDRLSSALDDRLDEHERDYLERMQRAAARMRGMIDDLLSLSRITTRAQPFARIDLNATAREVLDDLEIAIQKTGAVVQVESLPTIQADALQMRQLFQNLISNALKFHQEGQPPRIRVHARPAPRPIGASQPVIEILFEDNGIGFDEKYLDRIFQPFARLHGMYEYEGSGMGLAICQKIVARHGGKISARSTPGQGSQFIVTLPVGQAGG